MANKSRTRGRTANVIVPAVSPTKRRTANEHRTQVSRSVSAGAGTRRGDRRDTHPMFSTGKTKTAGGKPASKGRSTRKN